MAQPTSAPASADSGLTRERFLSVFPTLVDELLAYLAENKMPRDALEWYRRNLEYNTPGGKLNRGLSVVDSLDILLCTGARGERTRKLSDQEYRDAAVLGWCVELLQAYFLVADDMMDASVTRRGQPCWYRVPSVGNIAINDSFMLEAAIYHLLKLHFRQRPYYGQLIELFHDTTFQTEMGQLIDLITAPEDNVDLSKFSLEKHHLIVVYKTAFYSFYLPVALAMRMAGITDEAAYSRASAILLPLGEYFQVQDDYLDCYGTPEQIGKVGTDIQDNKCSWLINQALASADAAQRATLEANYGRRDAESESRVKDVFEQLGLRAKFQEYEAASYARIRALIESIDQGSQGASGSVESSEAAPATGLGGASAPPPVLRKEVFYAFLHKVYKRTK